MQLTFHLFIYSILAILLSSIFTTTSVAKSTDIYKWVDAEGRVNYTTRPGNDAAQKMHIGSKTFRENKQEKNDKKAQERAQLCQKYKTSLAKYNKAPFLSRYDKELKKNIRLTEEESEKAILSAEKDVAYWCNPPQKQDN
ncbi:MAG: DUF4124 domain-containing protein [Gammaproteobacteria bacterium]|nr:DUF4124 domain-containing protein [Gammaproteobacteria bacterium]